MSVAARLSSAGLTWMQLSKDWRFLRPSGTCRPALSPFAARSYGRAMRSIRVIFSCMMCGLETDTVQLGSPSGRSRLLPDGQPAPHCPRCGGRLFPMEGENAARDYLEPVRT